MKGRLAAVVVLSSGLVACRYGYSLPNDAQVTCAPGGAPCPPGWTCAEFLGRCVPDGTPITGEVNVTGPTSLQTLEGGPAVALAVTLAAPPTAIVRLPIQSTDTAEARPIPAELDFTADNWNVTQTVTVQGIADNQVDGSRPYEIVLGPPESADSRYSALPAIRIPGTNADQDTARIRVSPGSVRTSETAGPPVPLLVSLNSMPSAPVTILVSSSLPSEVVAAPASVTIQPADWNVPAVVLLTGQDDAVADGEKSYTIDFGPASSADPSYNGGTASVAGKNDDNESAGVEVIPTGGLITYENGTPTPNFSVRLRTPPTAPVSITFQSATPSEATLSPPQRTLTFDSGNWSTNQVVSVLGVDDGVVDGDVPFVIHSDNAVSADPAYSGYDVPEVNGTNKDNDQAQIVTTTIVSTISEHGEQGRYNVRLTSPPAGTVTINIRSGRTDRSVVAPASVALTSTNWQTGQFFNLNPIDDEIRDDDAVFDVTFDPAIATQDPAYANKIAPQVAATVLDDERIMFVTPDMYAGDMGGDTPDGICVFQASRTGVLIHPPKALLSFQSLERTRIASTSSNRGDNQVDWVLQAGMQYLSEVPDGAIIARADMHNLLPLETGELVSPLSPRNIWTGLLPDWTSGEDCAGWTAAVLESGYSGKGTATNNAAISNGTNSCNLQQSIVCVEQ